MFPAVTGNIDLEALSGICGSISIACWVVVFSPQIIENFRRGSADGLSLLFLIVWLAGDVFNILGAVLQGVLPTMIILAVYYTLADVVLLAQCFYYRGFTLRDEPSSPPRPVSPITAETYDEDTEIPSPVVPRKPTERTALLTSKQRTTFFNGSAIILVCAAGILGWYISQTSSLSSDKNNNNKHKDSPDDLKMDTLGQVFGYLCAVLYLGSRLPQILLNYRRKSTDGVSLLFFLFACIGNLTYVLSILAYSPVCERSHHGRCRSDELASLYGRYILVNLSWLIGSFGTLLLDMCIFIQFFLYQDANGGEVDAEAR
ncbi:uncharacterized protein An09g06510 [Aspergillus niger]|uniref:Contig An09c0220, genomic contig n=2 Tax=Aspergillus niger TaxID=5061 RepID=A2QUR4_ASPNC|nr:uncharacterized protein An09g06510 [Aspergillus niger]CAK40444.1 unnamed protein product [Aspergillus niger]